MNSLRNRIILSHIAKRIYNNKNALILVVGEVGSGKSYAAIRASEKLSQIFGNDFSMGWLDFDVPDLMDMFQKDNQPGQCIICDEIGVGAGSRTWQSRTNILMSYVAQTIRFKRHVVFFTVPNLSFVDVHLRKLFHYIMRPVAINRQTNTCRCSFKMLTVTKAINDKTGKLYEKYIRYKIDQKMYKISGHLDMQLPSQHLIDAYEKKKQDWANKLYKDAVKELRPEPKETTVDKRIRRIVDARRQGMTFSTIAIANGLSKGHVHRIYQANKDTFRHKD